MRYNRKAIILVLFAVIFCFSGCVSLRPADNGNSMVTSNDSTALVVSTTEPDSTFPEAEESSDTTATTEPPETFQTTAPETEAETSAPPETSPYDPDTSYNAAGYPMVLTYHLIYDEPFTQYTNLFVPTADFESQLQNLNNAGYKYLFADEFGEVDEKSVVLTFDDGYEDNYTNMFPLLKKYNAKATVFMIAYKVDKKGYLTSAQIKEMAESGLVQFGSHTASHYDLRGLDEASLRAELNDSKVYLESLTGQKINTVCYPAGGFNDTVLAVAAEFYNFGFTTVPGRYDGSESLLAIPRRAVQRGTSGPGVVALAGY